VGHRLGLATRIQISVCKSPFPSAGTAVSLFRVKMVQQRPVVVKCTVRQHMVKSHPKIGWLADIDGYQYRPTVLARCLSVHLSIHHTPVLCVNGYIYPQSFSPSGSPTILVFPYQTKWQYSDGDAPNGGAQCKGV